MSGCSVNTIKVILYGLPMNYCDKCHEISGMWSFIMEYLPFTGVLYVYEGSYRKGIWGWLTCKE